MKVSVITPTRKRFESLCSSLDSLVQRSRSAEIEAMLAVDDDDLETLESLRENPIPNSQLLVGPRLGYINLHRYVNALSERATGDWLFLWNDDCLMETDGWDEIIAEYQGQLVVLNPEANHPGHPRHNCIFPIVPMQMVKALGHFSMSNHNDTYVEHIANELGIRRDVPIRILHDRADLTGGNDDEVFAERQFTTSEFYGSEIQGHIRRDIETLRPLLQGVRA